MARWVYGGFLAVQLEYYQGGNYVNVQEFFFESGKFVRSMNLMFIVLVPKKAGAN